jgi:hypothetical protein
MASIYHKLIDKLTFVSNILRYVLCLLFFSWLASSCREKDKNVSPKCEGFFVSTFNFNSGRPYDAQECIIFTNSEHNDGFKNLHGLNTGMPIKGLIYNWRNRHYYFTKPVGKGTPSWKFSYFNLDLLQVNEIGRSVFEDTSNHAAMYTFMTCNTLSDIVYCFTQQGDTCKLFEVSRNGVFGICQIGVFDTAYDIWSVAVDESSGYIFILQGNTLKKINPNTGNTSDVATYSDADPGWLNYNDNDKMFYALDRRGQYRLLRINPANGALTVQGTISGVDTTKYYSQLTFDRCNNQLIILQQEKPASTFYLNAYWITLKDAKLAKSVLHLWATDHVSYINGPFPEKK